ncbi:MAG: SEC-C domain-containing protein [Nannocystis sp.]|nr:SEC-C domain-containing protein [Nannocystis sp.]
MTKATPPAPHVHGPSCDHDHDHDHHDHDHKAVPYVRIDPKLGRNDPCHCGSGAKYKRCHGA